MKYTSNYNLKKPEGTDVVNIDDLNENADRIDQKLKELEDGVHNAPPNSVNDSAIGTRTPDQTQVPTSPGSGTLSQILSWLANRIKAITGKTNWWDAPPTTLQAAKNHIDAAAPHSGHETPSGAQAKVDTHASSKQTHGIGTGYYIAKTSRADQLVAWDDIQGKPNLASAAEVQAHVSDNVKHITSSERTAWNNKLDASAYTAADVLAKVKTVDGSGSGLDADLLDGAHAGNGPNNVLKLDSGGFVPLSNIPGTLTGKSADMVDGKHFSDIQNDAQAKVNTHANSKQTHGISSGYYIAKTSRSDQLPAWNDIQGKPSLATTSDLSNALAAKVDKPTSATSGNIAVFDGGPGKLKDGGIAATNIRTSFYKASGMTTVSWTNIPSKSKSAERFVALPAGINRIRVLLYAQGGFVWNRLIETTPGVRGQYDSTYIYLYESSGTMILFLSVSQGGDSNSTWGNVDGDLVLNESRGRLFFKCLTSNQLVLYFYNTDSNAISGSVDVYWWALD